jgi:hypothetical protein
VVLQNTIKAARMRGLRRSGVMENVGLSCCLLTILREIALLGQPLTYTLGVGHMSIRYLGTQTFDSKRLGFDLAFLVVVTFAPGLSLFFIILSKTERESRTEPSRFVSIWG